MARILFVAFSWVLIVPGLARATATAEEVIDALDVPTADLVDVAHNLGEESMLGVTPEHGTISSVDGDMGAMFTGVWDNVITCMDDDISPVDSVLGDTAEIKIELTPPDGTYSFRFDFYFLTREYPDFVGSVFNDTFTVIQQSEEYSGNIVFDRDGNEINVNSVTFTVVDQELLHDTGFDCGFRGGGTGWLTTTSSCAPGQTFSLAFNIGDVSDGEWDSLVMLDNFVWSSQEEDGPLPATDDVDEDGYNKEEDCDDFNAEVNPGVPEDCYNSIDDDCDGLIDEEDDDCDEMEDDDTDVGDDDFSVGDDDTWSPLPPDDEGGCGCVAGAVSLASTASSLAVLGGVLLLRRRSGR